MPDVFVLIDLALVAALLVTAGYAVALRREFKRFKTYNTEYASVLAETGRAMAGVERAVDSVQRDGASVLAALGAKIEEARAVAARLEAASRATATATVASVPETLVEETPPPFRPRPDQKPKAYAWPTVVVKRLPDETA